MSQKPTGLKAPSKIGRPTGLPQPKSSGGLPTPTKAQSAIEKSARAAGIKSSVAEKYAADLAKNFPGPELQAPVNPDDDYKIGDYVYVGGTKGGRIAYIGETQFAPGEWAGVVLDEAVGKNDGSVSGVRYFQCEMKRGVFSRLAKLSKQPVSGSSKAGVTPAPHPPGDGATGPDKPRAPAPAPTTNGTVVTPPTPSAIKTVASTPKPSNLLKRGSISGSQTNLKSSPTSSTAHVPGDTVKYNFKVGDRVLVSGTKTGVLRYVGLTDFAKGEWAGVELDDPLGKNDGTVAGKRYFVCKPLYGLFAPVHKVAKATGVMATPVRRSSVSKLGLGLGMLSRDRSGSQDSVSSISSTTSNTSRSAARVRLGVTSLNNQQAKTAGRPSPGASGASTALQKALKEKEEHVEQLLRERDLERSELAKCSAQADEAEGALLALRSEHERILTDHQHLKGLIEKLEKEKRDMTNQVEEERRKVEDLQFAVEEETINKGDLESQSEIDHEMMKSMQDKLNDEIAKVKNLEAQLNVAKSQHDLEKTKVTEAMDSTDYYLDRIEELTHKLTQAEKKIKSFEEEKKETGSEADEVTKQVNLKNQQISELKGELGDRDARLRSLENKATEQQEKLQEADAKKQKLQDNIDELMKKVATNDTSSSKLTSEVHGLKAEISDLKRQLKAAGDKTSQLDQDKSKLEHQIEELMSHSGDSSEQLSLLAEQIRQRDRELEQTQAALSNSTQKLGKLAETVEQEREKAEVEMEVVLGKHGEDLKAQEERIQELLKELEKANNKLSKTKESHEQQIQELTTKKDTEITDLKGKLHKHDDEGKVKAVEMKSLKETISKLQSEQEEMKYEKEKADKAHKKVESEVSALTTERDKLTSERDQLLAEKEKVLSNQGSSQAQIDSLTAERDQAQALAKKVQTEKAELEASKQKLSAERDVLAQVKETTQAELTARDTSLKELVTQVEQFSTEFKKQKDQLAGTNKTNKEMTSTIEKLKEQLSSSKKNEQDAEGRLKGIQTEKADLQKQVAELQKVYAEKEELQSQHKELKAKVDQMTDRHSSLMESIESQTSALKSAVESHQVLLQRKDSDIKTLTAEMKNIKEENSTLTSKANTAKILEKDKLSLEKKVQQLESALKESKANANIISTSGDPALAQLKEEKDTAEKQAQFLNSVIIDLQRKNDELKTRLEAMEMGTVVNGNASVAMDISETTSSRLIAPRMFCDICEVFDLHDTDDCPKQSMSESPPASQFHGSRGDERPYCDICEVFGHWTNDCDDEQTF